MAYNDLLKASNFLLQLKDQEALEYFVQEVTVPGMNLGEINYGTMAQGIKRPGDNINWNPLVMTIVCDEDFKAFRESVEYIFRYKNPETGVMEWEDGVFDGYLFLTTNKNNVKHKIHFHDCWISNISDIQLSTTTSEEETPNFTVEIIFSYYMFEKA